MFIFSFLPLYFISLLVCNIYLVMWWVWKLSLPQNGASLIDWLIARDFLGKINKLINKSLTGGCAFWSFNSLGLGWLDLCKICTFEGTKWKSITKNDANTEFETFVEWKGRGQLVIWQYFRCTFGGEYRGAENVKGIVVVSTNALCRTSNEWFYFLHT